MASFNQIFKNDYDKRIKLSGEYLFAYSPNKMKELYPDGGFVLVGETSGKKAKDSQNKVGSLTVGKGTVDVHHEGKHGNFLNKVEGYVCVSNDSYIAVYQSRIPFLTALLALILFLAAIVIMIIWLLNNPKSPIIIDPDNPLPEIDPNIETIEQDTDEKVTSEEGGGFVSIVWEDLVTISLSSDIASISYENPNSSNHGVVLELYIVSDNKEYFIGKTGIVPPGCAVYELDVSQRDVNVREGIYKGIYHTYYYNLETGERAVLSTDIEDVSVAVVE